MRVSQVASSRVAAELAQVPVGVEIGILQRVLGVGVVARIARATRKSACCGGA